MAQKLSTRDQALEQAVEGKEQTMKMKIAIIGAGNIGGTLGKKWVGAGHAVCFGVRTPADEKFDDVRPMGPVVAIAEALAGAEVILLSLPGAAVTEFVAQFGASLAGKLVIDATNNVGRPELNNLAALKAGAPGAQLARAFSTLGWENFADPQIAGTPLDLFYCAEAAARPVTEQLIEAVGLCPVCLGDLDAVGLVDGLTRVWFTLVFGQGRSRRLGLKLLLE